MERNENHQVDSGRSKCPLMGATSAVASIDNAYMLVIGTEECTYYTKASHSRKGGADRCFSVVLDNHDVTFGSADKVEVAVEELMQEYKPELLFLITTCVVEIIGDDFESIVSNAKRKYGVPIYIAKTNHFKGEDEEDGFKLIENLSNIKLPSKDERRKMKMMRGKAGNPEFQKEIMKNANLSKEEKMRMMKMRGNV